MIKIWQVVNLIYSEWSRTEKIKEKKLKLKPMNKRKHRIVGESMKAVWPQRSAGPCSWTSAIKTRSSSSRPSPSSGSVMKPTFSSSVLVNTNWRKLLAHTSTDWKFCHNTSPLYHHHHHHHTPCPGKKEATLFSTTTLAFRGRFL